MAGKNSTVELDAVYDQDSKRYHRFRLDDEKQKDVVGNLYVSKDIEMPEKVILTLKTKADVAG